jgi:hypoxanthine phosphoribosyltransferase
MSAPGGTVAAVGEEPAAFQAYRGSEAPRFANQAELEVASLLDFYGIPWDYEPQEFVLEQDAEGRVLEATRPDFYLPEQDLYLEVTTMKQSLVTRKNRKIRKLRERYPEVKVKLFYKRDLERLVEKYSGGGVAAGRSLAEAPDLGDAG